MRVGAALIPMGPAEVSASSTREGYAPAGAVDGDRFSTNAESSWQGAAAAGSWWWQVRFPTPRTVGAILQITGDHPFVQRNAPARYLWQASDDGVAWRDLESTRTPADVRTFRLHRLDVRERASFFRLRVDAATGPAPTLREVEFYDGVGDQVPFPPWIVVVNATDNPGLPGHGADFIPLARSVPGWESLGAQQVWLGSFDEPFLSAEPRPLCGFLSGTFAEWCQIDRAPWRGAADVLRRGNLPLWASCGGAQALAIIADVGVEHPWDCPHCRDPLAPKSPIYTHIGHTNAAAHHACGDYSDCVFERGSHTIRQVGADPAFQGLPEEFPAMESHCGQIERPPRGWRLVATAGPGTLTRTQCLRVEGRYIYAAQFHIEMAGADASSRAIMGNFLSLARNWGGWNPDGRVRD